MKSNIETRSKWVQHGFGWVWECQRCEMMMNEHCVLEIGFHIEFRLRNIPKIDKLFESRAARIQSYWKVEIGFESNNPRHDDLKSTRKLVTQYSMMVYSVHDLIRFLVSCQHSSSEEWPELQWWCGTSKMCVRVRLWSEMSENAKFCDRNNNRQNKSKHIDEQYFSDTRSTGEMNTPTAYEICSCRHPSSTLNYGFLFVDK